jgi:SAM-dependent methyltransferase
VDTDPVQAYDRIAPEFARLSQQRRAYLDQIDQLVISEIPRGAVSMLDIGAGDGLRAARIARACQLTDVVMLEPSAAMRGLWPPGTRAWPIRAEELSEATGQFDVITCLWNVLGHIFPAAARIDVLRQCARLLSANGRLLIDIAHRCNARHYGLVPTLLRMLRDRVLPNEENGDVTAGWSVNGPNFTTKGHVFTDGEFRRISSAAGLKIHKRFAVDYATGQIHRSKFAGQLLYVASLSASSLSAPSSARQTSSISSSLS